MSTPHLDAQAIYASLLAQLKQSVGNEPVLLVGIHTGGAWVAQQLAQDLLAANDRPPADGQPPVIELGFLSSAFHRDDIARRGLPSSMKATQLPMSIDDRDIVLIDDILFTGRTIRAALNELFDYGRPQSVRLAVLVDRGGRQLPVQADYCGATIELDSGQSLRLSQDTTGRLDLQRIEQA
ncbi:MAG: bifunctional pyr operon transcriptional regulator/uracil phosphoribosyltransferase PyrR [Burkholderiaceae bacterium]